MNKKQKTMNLTVGRPLRQIFLFAVPLVFGTIFQQLYSFADTVIVGRCLGTDALAAVGATSSLHFLILGFVQGACVGFGIPVAQSFGADDHEEMHRYLWNGTWLCVFLSTVLAVAATGLTETLLTVMNTPEEIFSMSAEYIGILFMGIPASVLYNYSASVMRAIGDSRHPFYFLLFSSILNIVLDYVLIMFFDMGVGGAAAATVFSQFVSGALNVWWMFRHMEDVRVKKDEMSPSLRHVKRLCIVGLPMGFEYSVSAIGAVIWVVLLPAAKPLVYIVLGETVSDVALGAQRYLFLCSCLFVFHGSLMIFRNTLQGMGYSFHAIISGVWELVGRSLGGWLAVHAAGFTAVCLANPMAWIFALAYCVVLVFYMIRKNEKRLGIY
ncbi:MATE family efflux transporter [Mediterraneibacter glycyrrhizinilyticus]|nr:MATE family efflux transporter [Mediterraneibacter glycyrrhizinilyticus]MBM6854554.1 MATE family efflux transporter [Mediterraneibacter glycyrrhizinilyticus]